MPRDWLEVTAKLVIVALAFAGCLGLAVIGGYLLLTGGSGP